MKSIEETYYGYNAPFMTGHQNILSRQSGIRLIQNDLKQILLVSPGERIMRPTFGSPLKSTVFNTISPPMLSLLASDTADAIAANDRRVNVNVSITADEERQLVVVNVVGRTVINDTPINMTFEV